MYYNKSENRKIVVVGGNAAGPGAAAKAKRTDPGSDVLMLEAGDFISTGTCELPYLFSGEIKGYGDIVFYSPETFYEDKGVKVKIRHRVTRVNAREKNVEVKNLSTGTDSIIPYDKLILATGSRAAMIPVLNKSYKNVFTLKNVADYIRIRDYLNDNKVENILIAGAGFIGLETADVFHRAGYDVKILDKNELPLASADSEVSKLVLEQINKKCSRYIGGSEINHANLIEGKVTSVKIGQEVLATDMIIVAAGFKPDNELSMGAGIEHGVSGGVKVSNKLKTSDNNIFAAGDLCEVVNLITGRPFYYPVATIAHDMGHAAGDNAAGGNSVFNPVVKNIAVKIFGKAFTQVGLSSEEAKYFKYNFGTVSEVMPGLVKVMPGSEKVFGKIIFDRNSGLILGAQFYGGKECIGYADLITMMIRNKIKAVELAENNYNYTPPLSPFINLLSVLGRKIRKH